MRKIILVGEKANGRMALIDDEDFELVNKHIWHIDGYGYAETKIKLRNVKMQRLITNAKKGEEIDHKNMNRLDNQKGNLRSATRSQNMLNRKKQINNKSGFKGVFWHKQIKRWVTNIKGRHVGTFKDKIDAAKAYNEIAKREDGEFARLNVIPNE